MRDEAAVSTHPSSPSRPVGAASLNGPSSDLEPSENDRRRRVGRTCGCCWRHPAHVDSTVAASRHRHGLHVRPPCPHMPSSGPAPAGRPLPARERVVGDGKLDRARNGPADARRTNMYRIVIYIKKKKCAARWRIESSAPNHYFHPMIRTGCGAVAVSCPCRNRNLRLRLGCPRPCAVAGMHARTVASRWSWGRASQKRDQQCDRCSDQNRLNDACYPIGNS